MSSDVQKTSFKVLVADDDGQMRRRMTDFLKEKGFEVVDVTNGKEAREKLIDFTPHFIIIDLMLPDGNAIDIMNHVKSQPHLKDREIKVIVTSGHNNTQNVKECLKNGAADYVIKPFKFEDMLSRIVFHIQKKRPVLDTENASEKKTGAEFYLHLIDMVLREASSGKRPQEIYFNLTKMLALTLKAVRCNILECKEDRQTGFVQASSDDRTVTSIQVDLNRYPEVLHVMNTEKVVVIEDLDYDPNLAKIREMVKTIRFDSMIVCPIKKDGEFYGVLSARMAKSDAGISDHDIRFGQVVAYVAGLVLSAQRPLPLELKRPA